MTDSEGKKVKPVSSRTTVKVSPEFLKLVKNEQNRLLNSGQPEPSQSELLYRAWEAYERQKASLGIHKTETSEETQATTAKVNPVPEPTLLPLRSPDIGDILHTETSELSDQKREFLAECSEIYDSSFGNALKENVKWFKIGMRAVAALERIGPKSERPVGTPDATGAGEQRIDALLDYAENEAGLQKEALGSPPKDLPGDRRSDQKRGRGDQPGDEVDPRKTGSGGGD